MNHFPSAVIEASRGGRCENRHLVDIVVADAAGAIHSVWGEQDRLVFPRSAIKALQALPLIESGAADAFSFEPHHIALACSSHNGEEQHVAMAVQMLERAGLEPFCLECGAQLPNLEADHDRLAIEGQKPQPIHNTCSGKHSGFLAFAAHTGLPTSGYVKLNHPVQREIASVLSDVTDAPHTKENCGIDGCSIPTYAIPLENLAVAFAKLGTSEGGGPKRSVAMARIRKACLAHPEMVGGTKCFDTDVMQAMQGRVFIKSGADGVYIAALPGTGLGIALKCHDGASRAAETAIANVVDQLMGEDQNAPQIPNRFLEPVLRNRNDIETGSLSFHG